MLNRIIFDTGINEIKQALHRRFTEEESTFLYEKLSRFDNPVFNLVLSKYLREDFPPKNMLGFFLSRCEEEQPSGPTDIDRAVYVPDLDFSQESLRLFRKANHIMLDLRRKGLLPNGGAIALELSKKWTTLPTDRLDNYLGNFLRRMTDINERAEAKAETEQPERTNA